eukprot:354234-Chlamydomonas_euryale.AAC.17
MEGCSKMCGCKDWATSWPNQQKHTPLGAAASLSSRKECTSLGSVHILGAVTPENAVLYGTTSCSFNLGMLSEHCALGSWRCRIAEKAIAQ